jgi:hypothetical protein
MIFWRNPDYVQKIIPEVNPIPSPQLGEDPSLGEIFPAGIHGLTGSDGSKNGE